MSQAKRRAASKTSTDEVPTKKLSIANSKNGGVKVKNVYAVNESEIISKKKTRSEKAKKTVDETSAALKDQCDGNIELQMDVEEEEEYSVDIVPPEYAEKTKIHNGDTSDEEDDTNETFDEENGDELEENDGPLRGNFDLDALMETALQHSQGGGLKEEGSQKRSYKREFNIPCAYCEVMLKDYGYLFRHVSRLHKNEPDVDEYLNEIRPRMRAACPICKKTVSSASNVSAHIKQCHAGEECSVKCPLCNKVYKTQISLKQHLRQCHQPQVRKHKCSHCDMTFTEGRSLKEHINCTHETTQIFRCDDCGKTFLTKGRLRRHKYIHSDFRHYCHYCEKGFHLKDNMNKHVEIMHEKKLGKRFQCPHCPKSFTVKGNMKQHILGVHLRQYAYNCPICGEGYRRKKDMLLHMEQHKEGMSTLKIEDVRIDPHTIKLPPPSVKVQMAPSDGLTTGTTVIEVLPQNIKVLTE